jgi:NADP-dependent 3-hydroxy acid dehydrogenase YdfG
VTAEGLADRVVAITGASRGIGRTVAEHLADRGAHVVMLARGEARLTVAANDIGERATAIVADIGDPDAVRAAFASIEERFGRLDALVNNAALAWPHRIEEATDAELLEEVSTNVLGPLYTIRAAIPLLRQSESGHIVNVSTESTQDPFPFLLVYAATKSALETLSRGLVSELKPDGIRVTLLSAGRTSGSEFREAWDAERRAEAEKMWDDLGFRARIAGTVAQPPEQVAEAVEYVLTRPVGSMVDLIHVRSHS